MTTINASSFNTYNAALQVAIKSQEAGADDAAKTEPGKLNVDLSGAKIDQSNAGGAVAAPAEDLHAKMIEQLEKQIEQTQKALQQQQAQLAAVQNGNLDEESKAQQIMAIQVQIAATNATLQALPGSLLQLMTEDLKGTKVNTTA